jgi:hypothetical protein
MKRGFKWLLIRIVVGTMVVLLSASVVISLIFWFILWPFVYLIKLISVNVDRNGEYISKKDWDDWIGGRR